jgi:hypothetical protein
MKITKQKFLINNLFCEIVEFIKYRLSKGKDTVVCGIVVNTKNSNKTQETHHYVKTRKSLRKSEEFF